MKSFSGFVEGSFITFYIVKML